MSSYQKNVQIRLSSCIPNVIGLKNFWICLHICRMHVDNSPIQKEKVADSKISGYVWMGPCCSLLMAYYLSYLPIIRAIFSEIFTSIWEITLKQGIRLIAKSLINFFFSEVKSKGNVTHIPESACSQVSITKRHK